MFTPKSTQKMKRGITDCYKCFEPKIKIIHPGLKIKITHVLHLKKRKQLKHTFQNAVQSRKKNRQPKSILVSMQIINLCNPGLKGKNNSCLK